MKTTILAAALLCGASVYAANAHATLLQCSRFNQISGYAGHNPPATATVTFGNGAWSVHYVLQNGQTVDRSTQFGMGDASDNTKTEWWGWLNKNPNKWMRGRIMKRNADGHLLYFEELFDRSNTLLASNAIDCGPDPDVAPPAPPVVVASAPSYQQPTTNNDYVPFVYMDGEMHVPVILSGTPVQMVIDTGATSMTVNDALAAQLVANGQASWTGATVEITIADGTKQTRREISINTLTVGDRTIHNVLAHTTPDGAEMLLGHLVLARLSSRFGINTASNTLDFD